MAGSPLDRRICPGRGRVAGKWQCRRCGFTADEAPITSLRDLLDPSQGDGPIADDVALGAFTRAVLRAVREEERHG